LDFPIVAIGASAGGLDAYKKFFARMPADAGMGFVLIPHLAPSHKSLMAELLSRQTTMPVCEAQHGMPIRPNHVYVIPPNQYLAIEKRALTLSAVPEPHTQHGALDWALCSLARDQQERAVGIILSGTGCHGILGLKEIRQAGGLVMVQDPATAQYDQMPRGALAAEIGVDHVLAPQDMPDALIDFFRRASRYRNTQLDAPDAMEAGALDGLNVIGGLLQSHMNFDIRNYRKNMIARRIHRRMALLRIEDFGEYSRRLRRDAEERLALRNDLLISVTAFFRQPEAFEALGIQVFPQLLARVTADDPVRLWVPACATGEEAYSIAMLLIEHLEASGQVPKIQVFATDIDGDSMKTARAGVYGGAAIATLSAQRLQRFFRPQPNNHYQVSAALRECIVFAAHDLISDPPFSRVDLISCQNVLIYLEPHVQKRIIASLHFALNEGGYLLLGPAESIGKATNLFDPVSKKWRIFRRVGTVRRGLANRPPAALADLRVRRPLQGPNGAPEPRAAAPFEQLVNRLLLKEFVPAAVLINRDYEVLSVQGPVGDFLEFPPGNLTKDLMSLSRVGLRTKLRATCNKALREHRTVCEDDARVRRNGEFLRCSITVRPIVEPRDAEGLMLVVFHDSREPSPATEPQTHAVRQSTEVLRLEDDLRTTREDLQTSIEELEASNEALRNSNEEAMSVNEEFQSANEELETSKEELQSINEELTTVNSQLEAKVEELDAVNGDLSNLITAIDIPVLFLDPQMRIKRFTDPAAKLLNLLENDINRPYSDLAPKFDDLQLVDDVRNVVETRIAVEKIIHTEQNRCHLRRILPYISGGDGVSGVVVAFIDVTEQIAADAQARRFASVLRDSEDAILVTDFNGGLKTWNRGAERLYGYTEAEALKLGMRDLVTGGSFEHMLQVMRRVAGGETIPSFDTQRRTRDGRTLDVSATVSLLRNAAGNPESLATTERDITARKRAEEELRTVNVRLEQRVAERTAELQHSEEQVRAILDATADAVVTIDAHGRIATFNRAAERIFGYAASEVIGESVALLIHTNARVGRDGHQAGSSRSLVSWSVGRRREASGRRKDGRMFPMQFSVNEVEGRGLFVGVCRDMTKYKALQKEVVDIAVLEQRRIGQELHDNIQQQLTGLGLLAQNLADALSRKDAVAEGTLAARVANGIAETNQHVRSLARGMIPVPIDREGLMSALKDLARQTEEIHGLTCSFECPASVEIDDDTEATHLYRIAQEAVSNAVKHAEGSTIWIRLEQVEGCLQLEIRDNGSGTVSQRVRASGVGLRLMEHRCGLIGGTFTIVPRTDGGTFVACSVPRVQEM
jgi:two-component system CheB/CheR fusion protein